ncbi:hypothetical protein ACFTS5_02240 [Nocardia sp. NPDC056952]|uniref:hypothetical protein n=1 Tax=Nocardia TaxID=1817 RepID=UPI00340AF473
MQDSLTPSPAQSRRDLVMSLGLGLVVFGAQARGLTVDGRLTGDQVRRLLPAGLVGAIGGELVASVMHLAQGRWAYASAALVRQLVEIEYLAWAVTNDPDDAWEWFKSDRRTRLQRWQPGKIRERSDGRFPNKDYHDHCEIGGHPVPEPAMNVLDHRDEWVEVTLYETVLHGVATWHYLLCALEGIDPISEVERHHRLIDRAYEAWRRTETMDSGLRSKTAISDVNPR